MKITIAERLHPFSHTAGTKFLIPFTSWAVQVFPTRLNFSDLSGKAEPFFLSLELTGPIVGFTAELDLEKGYLSVFGKTLKGFMRYRLEQKENGIYLTLEKAPEDTLKFQRSSDQVQVGKNESVLLCQALAVIPHRATRERLSLGMHKAQDWTLMHKRCDFKEIFPHWLRLAAMTPGDAPQDVFVSFHKKIAQGKREAILEEFQKLFLASFEGVLVPRVNDADYQGIALEFDSLGSSPLSLLTSSAHLIRSLFYQETPDALSLHPCLPPEFHCGRMVGIPISQGRIDFEWTKKSLRIVLIHADQSGEMRLKLPKGVRSCRLKRSEKALVDSSGYITVRLEANKTLCLDRFEG